MIGAGRYVARAVPGAWELGTSPTKGSVFIRVSFRVEGGEADGECVTWDGYFAGDAEKRTMESLRHCGWQGFDVSAIEALPNAVSIVVEHNEWTTDQGETRVFPRVAWVNKLGGPSVKKPLQGAALMDFAQRMKGLAHTIPVQPADGPSAASHGRSSQQPGCDPGPGADAPYEDDIPF